MWKYEFKKSFLLNQEFIQDAVSAENCLNSYIIYNKCYIKLAVYTLRRIRSYEIYSHLHIFHVDCSNKKQNKNK